MNYRTFRFRAVVDWIEILIQTTSTTNFHTVQRAFGAALRLPVSQKIHITAKHPNEGGGTCHFTVRIHDVTCYSDIHHLLIQVAAKLSLNPGFKIDKIELALDAYCDDPAGQAARFYKFMTHPVSDNRRMYRAERDLPPFGMPNNFDSISRHLSEGWQIGIGNTKDDRYQHIYFKTTDGTEIIGYKTDEKTGKSKPVKRAKPLPPEQWRARIEIRLSGAALPCQTAEEWAAYRFEELAQYFRFTQLKDDLEPLMQKTAEAIDQIGERKTRKRAHEGRESGTRLHSKATLADVALNNKARDALRKLSARWKATKKRSTSAWMAAGCCCGNTGGINGQTPHKNGEERGNSNNYVYENNITNTDDKHEQHIQHTNGRNCERSNESASPIQPDSTHGAIDELMQQHKSTPEAIQNFERIEELFRE